MAYDRFLIAPYQNGLRKDLPSWQTPEDSFQTLNNVNLFRGKIVKRFGGDLIGTNLTSRARIALTGGAAVGVTDGAGAATGNITTHGGGLLTFKHGQTFSIGDDIFTIYQDGTPANMLSTNVGATGTFNTTSGAYVFAGATPATQIYFYPTFPIMGITHYEKGPINEHVTYVMDTKFIYKFDGTSFIKDTAFAGLLHGSDSQFFWSANYLGTTADQIALFTTNFNATLGIAPPATDDPIYYFDGTNWANYSTYTKFNSAQDYVASCKIIVNWKNRLLLLNTMERDIAPAATNIAYHNRVRYSHNGNPFPSGVAGKQGHPWLQRRNTYVDGGTTYVGDGGGYIDAPVEEQIISAVLIKDRLIVYFERSTWELAYTGNVGLPFIWKAISPDVGCESTFSITNVESEIVSVDTTGVYSCNGASIGRIDNQIPNEIFSFLKTANGTKRVHGIKDYYNELIYWTFLDHNSSSTHTYPDKILVFNYKNSSWSLYDDTITTFGYFEQSEDRTWAYPGTWATTETWGSYYSQGKSRRIIAGNHQGYIFLVNNDKPRNAPVMQVANITPATGVIYLPDHNLDDDDFILIEDDNITNGIFKIKRDSDDQVTIINSTITGTYLGGGTVTRVSKIDIKSKDWNPYIKNGNRVYLAKIDFCTKNIATGQATVYYHIDEADGVSFVADAIASGTALGTNILEFYGNPTINRLDAYKKILWNSVYFQALGDHVNINITLSDEQMLDDIIALSPFELQGMILYTSQEGK